MLHGSLGACIDISVEYLGFEDSNLKDGHVDLEDSAKVVLLCIRVMQPQ
jgi:hypothetical protein